MAFRILIIGGPQRVEYARLRAALDQLLANRLPDVEVLTAGGPGVPALASCYAAERGLALVTVPIDVSRRNDTEAAEYRAVKLAGLADAAVLVGDPVPCRKLLDAVAARKLRVALVSLRVAEVKPEQEPPMLRHPPPAGIGYPD